MSVIIKWVDCTVVGYFPFPKLIRSFDCNCLQTDIENIDYTLETGATWLFEAEKLARQMEEQERKLQEEKIFNDLF